MKTAIATVREAFASALSQPVASLVTIVMVAGMCVAVLLTTGRTVGAERTVLGSIDSAGTRSIVIRAEPAAGLEAGVLERMSSIEGIDWAGGFAAAVDVTNSSIEGGTRVPLRMAWSEDWTPLELARYQPVANRTAWVTSGALSALGMRVPAGGLTSADGEDFAIGGSLAAPDFLSFLEPLAIAPQQDVNPESSISVLVVVAASPELVAPVARAVESVLAVEDPTKVTISTSEDLAALRALVEGQLGSFGRALVVVIFAAMAVLVAALLFGLVMLRRRDFGRRRALGATRGLIVALLLVQVATLSVTGALIGSLTSVLVLVAGNDPLPGVDFILAIDILAVAVGTLAGMVPAVSASRRDPLVELRVP